MLRRLVLNNPALASFVLALALAMKLVVPAGFMPTVDDGHIVISICTGTGPMKMVMAVPGKAPGEDGGHHEKAEQPCAFAGLSLPSLAAADPALLAAAILFVMVLGLRPIIPIARTAAPYLRPPLRGPPHTA